MARHTNTVPDTQRIVQAPKLWIERRAWVKIGRYVSIVPGEINGFGFITVAGNQLVVRSSDDIFITRQKVSPVSADINAGDSAMALYEAMRTNRADDLRLQWHSHGNGSAYCSNTDVANIEKLQHTGATWWVSLVVTKQGAHYARLDMYGQPAWVGIEMEVEIFDHYPDLDADCQRDIDQLVEEIKFETSDAEDNDPLTAALPAGKASERQSAASAAATNGHGRLQRSSVPRRSRKVAGTRRGA